MLDYTAQIWRVVQPLKQDQCLKTFMEGIDWSPMDKGTIEWMGRTFNIKEIKFNIIGMVWGSLAFISFLVLGKVRDFLGVISEANRRLELDAKEQSSKDYDIEVLNGNESQYIEMDLMLGIADLHTPEAVAAAKSAISGYQPVIPLAASSSGTESEDSSDDDDDDDDDDDSDSGDDGIKDEKDKTCSSVETKRSKSMDDNALTKLQKHQLKKRPKIVELP